MRTLFLLLLLANLLFAAWAHWVAPAPSASGHATPSATGQGGIQLLREVPAVGAQSSSDSDLFEWEEAGLACVSFGPFLARAEAVQAATRLGRLGFVVRLREAREDVRIGQWVRIEGLATPDDAENARTAVQAAGLADAIVITEEGLGLVVSLGVHADPARAEATAAFARVAGFEPRIVDRLRPEDVTWLDVDGQANGGLPAIDDLQISGAVPRSALTLRPCPTAVAAAR